MSAFASGNKLSQTASGQRFKGMKLPGFILAIATISFLPDLSSSVFPAQDARQCLSAFHFLYKHWFYHGDLPLWMPNCLYGAVSILLMMYVTPIGFCVAALGKLFGVTDVLFLFKIVVLLEFLLFVAGSIKLSFQLFKREESVLLVGLGATFSFCWLLSLDANFHAFYLMPIIIRRMVQFFSSGQMRELLIAGIFCVLSCFGNVPYHAPELALILTVFGCAMLALKSLRGTQIKVCRTDIVLLLIILAGGAVHAGVYLLNFNGLDGFSSGRDPVTHAVDKDVFLTYAGVTKVGNLAHEYLLGAHTQGDTTFYVGLAPLLLGITAFIHSRRRECLAFAGVAAFLLAFSFGGWTASVAYYFPGMWLYRHVGLIFGQLHFFLLILAGFGLDHFLTDASTRTRSWYLQFSPKEPGGVFRIIIVGVIVSEVVLSRFNDAASWSYSLFPSEPSQTLVVAMALGRAVIYFTSIAAGFIYLRCNSGRIDGVRLIGICLLIAYGVDIVSFKVKGILDWPVATESNVIVANKLFQPHPRMYVSRRANPTKLIAVSSNLRLMTSDNPSPYGSYVHVWETAEHDSLEPWFRTDFLSQHVVELFRLRGLTFDQHPGHLIPEGDIWIRRAIGAAAPKMRLIPDPLDEAGVESPVDDTTAESLGGVSIVDITANTVMTTVRVASAVPVRLYYADSFHPGWRASVDGVDTPIQLTNFAFKSVKLQPGEHLVEFKFFNGWGSICLYMLAIASIGLGCFGVVDLMRASNLSRLEDLK